MIMNNKKISFLAFKSRFSKDLSIKEINDICKLKNQKWKFGIQSQKNWFNNNIKKNDIHNLLYINSNLAGYTSLRKKIYNLSQSTKKLKYILFDTFIIEKNFKNKKLSNFLMDFNKMIIKQNNIISILLCEKILVGYYKKRGWLKVKKGVINLRITSNKSNIMFYNSSANFKKLINLK